MKRIVPAGLTGLTVLVAAVTGSAGEPKKQGEPKLPLKLTLKPKESKSKLDLGGMSAADFQKALEAANKAGGRFPAGPKVEVEAELKNTSDKDVTVWIGGDPTSFTMELKGPDAKTYKVQRIFTRIFYAPKPVTLAPGQTHQFGFKNLKYGYRGVGDEWFVLQPGEYTLTVSYNTALSPAPPGSKADNKGFGRVVLQSNPVKIQVEGK